MTLDEKFESTNGRPAGFDYMRLLLSLAIFAWHTVPITYGPAGQANAWHNFHGFLVWMLPSFFALSGFLVAGSLERCKTIAGFIYLRIIRIFPALIVEITVSALVLGPVMTQLPIASYFHNAMFYDYFMNCLGLIHYHLPGVFLQNPNAGNVNLQLWTIPHELQCYVILGALGLIGIAHNRWLFLAAVLGVFALSIGSTTGFEAVFTEHRHVAAAGQAASGDSGFRLVLSFLSGVLFFSFRRAVPYNAVLAVFAFLAAVILFRLPAGGMIAPLPLAYVVVFLGLANPYKIALLGWGDYSYGIYLYSFPIQQAVVATRLVPLNPWWNLFAAMPFVFLLAFCSWHLWEKKVLGLRRYRPMVDEMFKFTMPGLVVRWIYQRTRPGAV